MASRSALVAVSAGQLASALAGLAVALRRRRNDDVGFMRGSPERVGRDLFWAGTAYSAPVTMLAAQLWATARLTAGPDDGARRVLGMLGATMVPGYPMERYDRQHLRPGGWDPVETPVVVAGASLAAAMAVLGHPAQAGR
jgi:hypothetical protein